MGVSICRFDRAAEVIRVGDDGRLWVGEDGGLVGARDRVSRGSLASLRAAVRRADHYLGLGREVRLTLYDVPENQLVADQLAFNPPPVDFIVTPDRSLVTCTLAADVGARIDRRELTARLSALLARRRLVVVELEVRDETAITVAGLTCEVRGRGRTLGEVASAADELLMLWGATYGGALSAVAAADLIRAGRPQLLVGEAESSWLEVKREPYRLDDPGQQLELAKDVAALANTRDGGLLVIGLATARRADLDVVWKVRPISVALIEPARYRRIIDRLVYPPIEGLEVEWAEVSPGKGVLAIVVPEQPQESRPLLVLGAIVGDKLAGSHVSIVRRRGDATTATHPAALHSLLAAGRAALGSLESPKETSGPDGAGTS